MKKRIALLIVVILCVTMCFAGCGKKEITKITLNEVTHSVFYAPQYAALNLGYFAEERIDVDIVNGGGSDKSMAALLSGSADIALMGPETAVYVYNEGKEDNAIIIGQLTKRDGSMLVAREKDDAFEWSHVKDKNIIGGRKGGMPNMTLEYVLKNNGLVPNEDVVVDTSVQFNLMAGAFEGSDADYVALFEPTASMTQEQGKGYVVAAIGNYIEDTPYTAYMVKKSNLKDNGDLYKRFIKAVSRGQKYVIETPANEIAKLIAPLFPDNDVELLTKVIQNYKDIGVWNSNPVMSEEGFERMQDIIEEAGVLEKRAPFDSVVDNSLAEAVK